MQYFLRSFLKLPIFKYNIKNISYITTHIIFLQLDKKEMKSIFNKAASDFINKSCGGINSLKSIKTYIQSHNLYEYKLENYYKYIKTKELALLATLPCSTSATTLESTNIKISKMIRSSLDIDEKLACKQCPKNKTCRQAFIESKASPTVADYVRFMHTMSKYPPQGDPELSAGAEVLDSIEHFVGNIKNYPIELKQMGGHEERKKEKKGNDDDNESGKSYDPIQAVRKKANKVKIPRKLMWKPKLKDEERVKRVEKRKEKKSLEREVDLLVRKTSVVVKGNKKHRRQSKLRKSPRK